MDDMTAFDVFLIGILLLLLLIFWLIDRHYKRWEEKYMKEDF